MVATRSKGPTTPKAKTSKKTASESKPSGGIVRQLLASPFAEKNKDTDKAVTGRWWRVAWPRQCKLQTDTNVAPYRARSSANVCSY